MSIARQLIHDLRPLFRILEDPLAISARGHAAGGLTQRSLFDDPFFKSAFINRPAVDVKEEGNSYILEAELPGVKKNDIEVRIGDSGRSVTIEGSVVNRQPPSQTTGDSGTEGSNEGPATAVSKSEDVPSNQISNERSFVANTSFSRTVWLPRPVDGQSVSAKLNDGVLTLKVPKAEDKASVVVAIE